jgi:ribose transport system ATP-binding protein
MGEGTNVIPDSGSRDVVLHLEGITKVYPGVIALDKVDFTVFEKELLGLVGENGAGKSTLMKILIGLVQPDNGTFQLRKQRIILRDPSTAIRFGIGMVFQEGSLLANLSIMENLFLRHEKVFQHLGFLSHKAMRTAAAEVLSLVKVNIDAATLVSEIPIAIRQMVEIARLLWLSRLYEQTNPILILDEPTTVLEEEERSTLFSIVKDLKKNASIILISHRLQEIVDNCDRITILKDGKNVKDLSGDVAEIAEIEHSMVGRGFSESRYRENEQSEPRNEVILTVDQLGKKGAFEPISFKVKSGEIVGLVGLVGSGKEDVCSCICGLLKPDSGTVLLRDQKIQPGSPGSAVSAGIGHIPIDRRSEGLALGMTVSDNVNMLILGKLKSLGLLNPTLERRNANKWIKECQIKTPSTSVSCATLSGGNQQKVVIAKWLSSAVRLLVLDHPTRGVDVGAKDEIYGLIRGLAKDGISMLIMCDTLEEDIGLSNRLLIMKDGCFVKEVECPATRKPTPAEIIGSIV